eukprot:Gb_17235 [translate_table: standard]
MISYTIVGLRMNRSLLSMVNLTIVGLRMGRRVLGSSPKRGGLTNGGWAPGVCVGPPKGLMDCWGSGLPPCGINHRIVVVTTLSNMVKARSKGEFEGEKALIEPLEAKRPLTALMKVKKELNWELSILLLVEVIKIYLYASPNLVNCGSLIIASFWRETLLLKPPIIVEVEGRPLWRIIETLLEGKLELRNDIMHDGLVDYDILL